MSLCPHFGSCGGCVTQDMPQSVYRRYTEEGLYELLIRGGLPLPEVRGFFWAPPQTRRRVIWHGLVQGKKVQLGYYAKGSHQLVDLHVCCVIRATLEKLLPPLKALCAEIMMPQKEFHVALLEASEGIAVDFQGALKPQSLAQTEMLTAFAEAHALCRLSVNGELILQRQAPTLAFGALTVPVVPGCFVQTVQEAEAFMVEKIVQFLEDVPLVADLFAGRGTFTGPLLAHTKVHAYEMDGDALFALQKAAGTEVKTYARQLFREPLTPTELAPYGGVVMNPPREGALAQAKHLALSTVRRVALVSCNPKTFTRDAQALLQGGYHLQSLYGVDQFLWSSHVEVLGFFVKDQG